MKKKLVKRMLSAALVMAMAVSTLAGCGSTTEEAKDTAADTKTEEKAEEKTDDAADDSAAAESDVPWDTSKEDTIIVSVINNFYTAGEKALAEEYMKLHPETEVIVDVIADNDSYLAKLVTAADGEYAPDIVHANFFSSAMGLPYKDLIEKGMLYDCTELLEEVNPYNGGKLVKDGFVEGEIEYLLASEKGVAGYLPLDRIGIGVYYNQDILDAEGIAVPTSFEELINACEALIAAGYDKPIGASGEATWMFDTIIDCAYRELQGEVLTVEGDALYDPAVMEVNNGFVFDDNNLACDYFTSTNEERMFTYVQENGVDTPVSRSAWELFFKVAQYFPKNFLSEDSTTSLTNFETQVTPLMWMPSYSVGNVNADIKMLPEDMQFNWGTTQLATIGEGILPEGFDNDLRALWVFGNSMGIAINEGQTDDHLERVKDFMKFWYSVDGATLCFEETLSAGNYIQGPCIIEGVELGEELDKLIAGFQTYSYKSLQRMAYVNDDTSENSTALRAGMMDCAAGVITLDEFMGILKDITDKSIANLCEIRGYDLDPTTADTPKQ